MLLRRMVDNIANSDDVRALRRYPTLRREIVTAAYRALEKFKEETRKMVSWLVGGRGGCPAEVDLCGIVRESRGCGMVHSLQPFGLSPQPAFSLALGHPAIKTMPAPAHPLAGEHHGGDGAQLHHRRILPHHPGVQAEFQCWAHCYHCVATCANLLVSLGAQACLHSHSARTTRLESCTAAAPCHLPSHILLSPPTTLLCRQMGKMPDGKVMYTLDGRPVTEEPEGSPEEKHYKRIINQASPWGLACTCAACGCRVQDAVAPQLAAEAVNGASRGCPCCLTTSGVGLRARGLPADDADGAQGHRALHGAAGALGLGWAICGS